MSIEIRLLQALWFILPAYIANSMPVNVSKVKELDDLGKPIDGGMKLLGARVLGDGKTWRGLFCGILIGTLAGAIQVMLHENAAGFFSTSLPHMSIELAFMLSTGALVGDIVASFVKRRSGLKAGDPAPLMDQLDFVFGAFFFAWLLTRSINPDTFFIIVVITPVIHIFANFIAWIWKLKRRPW
jgi:CDP-2,3-bis-(O-geranylgeranyl)-sn-glycerol synthase